MMRFLARDLPAWFFSPDCISHRAGHQEHVDIEISVHTMFMHCTWGRTSTDGHPLVQTHVHAHSVGITGTIAWRCCIGLHSPADVVKAHHLSEYAQKRSRGMEYCRGLQVLWRKWRAFTTLHPPLYQSPPLEGKGRRRGANRAEWVHNKRIMGA